MRISDWSSDVCSSDLPMLVKVPRSLRYKRISPVLIETAKSRSPSRSKSAQLFDSEPGTLKSVGCTGVKAGSVVPAASPPAMPVDRTRSDERRVGQECVGTCRYRASTEHSKTKQRKAKY